MDLSLFDDALVLLEEGNMTRAAERRNITQPAFSRRIRQLEEWLDAPIVHRGSNRIEIAPALSGNADEIRALCAHIREVRARIAAHDQGRMTVPVAAQHSLIFAAVPDFTKAARLERPDLHFQLHAGDQHECLSMFMSGEAKMLFCYETLNLTAPPFHESIDRWIWGRDRLLPVVGGSLRYHVSADGTLPDQTPAVIYFEGSFFAELLTARQAPFAVRATTPNPVYESSFVAGMKEMALNGLGVAWLPASLIHQEIRSGALKSCAERYGDLELQIAIYTTQEMSKAMPGGATKISG